MRAPKTVTILVLSVGMLLLSGAFKPAYFPAAKPVLSADGSPVLGPDGKPVVHRDMAKYYRLNRTSFVLMGTSACLFGWWMVRVSKHLYACYREGRNAS